MNEAKLAFIYLLLCDAEFTQCFPVTSSQGGNRSVWLFYCKDPGCVTNVICVFCNDELIWGHSHIAHCTGPPPPNSVCQHEGRAFVSIDTHGDCEFEGNNGYIKTETCTDHSNICVFTSVTRDGTPTHCSNRGYILSGVCSFLLLIGLCLIAHFCKRKRNRELNRHLASGTEPLREMQSPREQVGAISM